MLLFIIQLGIIITPVSSASTCGYYSKTWHSSTPFCTSSGSVIATGDFNGDGRSDMLCHESNGNLSISYAKQGGNFNGNEWTGKNGWCSGSNDGLLVGDFDGDGKQDLLCHNAKTGKQEIDLADLNGQFGGPDWSGNPKMCIGLNQKIYVADTTGDGRADLICHDESTGTLYGMQADAEGQFNSDGWKSKPVMCYGELYTKLIADFNGDGKEDLLCHQNAVGANYVALAQSDGVYDGSGWSGDRFCGSNNSLWIGYVNPDSKADLICHHKNSGDLAIAHTTNHTDFGKEDWSIRGLNWCNEPGANILVADYNGDHKSDLMCHGNDGSRRILYAECL